MEYVKSTEKEKEASTTALREGSLTGSYRSEKAGSILLISCSFLLLVVIYTSDLLLLFIFSMK